MFRSAVWMNSRSASGGAPCSCTQSSNDPHISRCVRSYSALNSSHPLRSATDADLKEQFDLAIQIRDKVSEANNAVIRIRKIKDDVKDRLTKSQDAQLKTVGERLTASLGAVEQDIYQVKNQSGQDPLNFPIKTNNRLASLLGMTLRGEGKPTANIYPIFDDLKKELKAELDRLEEVLGSDMAAFNNEAKRAGVDPIK